MRPQRDLAIALAIFAALAWSSCGDQDLVIAGNVPPPTVATTMTPSSDCGQAGDECSTNTDCCSGFCFSPNGVDLECN